ncbi:MAG TPA: peptide-methionine (S)-S-oxide reductase MsrA [Rhizomicrobium sp.]|jgi:peptide-methionine (S)-S-oxide reductase
MKRFAAVPIAVLAALLSVRAVADEQAHAIPAPAVDESRVARSGSETAVLSGGCFWGMQGLFEHVKGVREVEAGYTGGSAATAHYEMTSTGTTGQAETVRIRFDPSVVTYGQVLRVFFSVAHDPTELDRQGPDEGPQYRSEVFFADAGQEKIARAYVAQLSRAHAFGAPIVTRIDPLRGFYLAESYHQDYLIHHPDSAYIVAFDMPKIAHLKAIYPGLYKPVAARTTLARTVSGHG